MMMMVMVMMMMMMMMIMLGFLAFHLAGGAAALTYNFGIPVVVAGHLEKPGKCRL